MSGLQILHVHFTGGERLRTGADRKPGTLGARARRRAPGLHAGASVLLRARVASAVVRGEEMTVVKFPARSQVVPAGWQQDELQQIVAACSGSVATGEASGWDVGVTEHGEPQVYLIGPPPDYNCILVHFAHRHPLCDRGRLRSSAAGARRYHCCWPSRRWPRCADARPRCSHAWRWSGTRCARRSRRRPRRSAPSRWRC